MSYRDNGSSTGSVKMPPPPPAPPPVRYLNEDVSFSFSEIPVHNPIPYIISLAFIVGVIIYVS